MWKSLLIGLGAGALALAGAAVTPVLVTVLAAKGGASVIVGIAAWRSWRRAQRRRQSTA